MKIIRQITLVALFLALGGSASAQNYRWVFQGTSFEGFPLHTRVDLGQGNYRPTVVDYDVWNEGNSIAFKENYVGTYYVIHNYTDEKGRPNGKDHNHKGEFASAHISLPHPPAEIRPGTQQKWPVSISRNTDCGWQFDKPSAALGTLYLKVGSQTIGSMDTNKLSGTTFEFNVGNGNPGNELYFTFITLLAGKNQAVTYKYVWTDGTPSSTDEGPSEDPAIPSWVWWVGGILLVLILFRKKK